MGRGEGGQREEAAGEERGGEEGFHRFDGKETHKIRGNQRNQFLAGNAFAEK